MSDLVEAMEAATIEDLLAVRKKIEACEDQLKLLRPLERLLAQKLGEQSTTDNNRPAAPRPPSSSLAQKRKKVLDYLAKNGAKSRTKVAEDAGISRTGRGNIHEVLTHDWFCVEADGMVSLTEAGDRAANTELP